MSRSRFVVLLAMCSLVSLPAPSQAAGLVNLSRYVAKIVSATTTYKVLDIDVLNDLCRDEDGCDVSLKGEDSGGGLVSGHRRLVMSQTTLNVWQTVEESPAKHTDGSTFDTVMEIEASTPTFTLCGMYDGDDGTGTDYQPGFLLSGSSFVSSFSCTLVVSD
jgi:hypothetical protein